MKTRPTNSWQFYCTLFAIAVLAFGAYFFNVTHGWNRLGWFGWQIAGPPPVDRLKLVCVQHLRTIDGAKEEWALAHKKTIGDTPTDADLFGPGKIIFTKPVCPANGIYMLNPMSNKPTCSIPGHTLP